MNQEFAYKLLVHKEQRGVIWKLCFELLPPLSLTLQG